MYTVAVKQGFIAYHYLVGGNWGAENKKHAHQYQVEVLLEGEKLDDHGYLADISVVKERLGRVIYRYKACTLNEMPEFKGLNPSIEHLARNIHNSLFNQGGFPGISSTTVKIWEDGDAWTSYREDGG